MCQSTVYVPLKYISRIPLLRSILVCYILTVFRCRFSFVNYIMLYLLRRKYAINVTVTTKGYIVRVCVWGG